jgi:putative transposase
MPRIARVVIPGLPHHVTQRGNNRQDVFFVDDDRRTYLKLLAQQSRKHGLALLGYCLMDNHVHHVVIPRDAHSLARALGRTHWLYSQYVNRLHGRSGHLWQNRFYSAALEPVLVPAVTRYVERNPLRARICRKPWLYAWSSAAAHCGRSNDPFGLLDQAMWEELIDDAGEWGATLLDEQDQREVRMIRSRTCRGRPLGSDSFLSKLERRLGRRLRALPVGRPKQERRANG